jgi:ABC-type antimicrobial peptide transport system permease subunit
VRFALIATHFEHTLTSNSNLDLVTFFEIERVNHSRGQPHCQTIAPFRYLHRLSLIYIVIVYLKLVLRKQMVNVLRATVRSIDPQLPLAQVQSLERAVSYSEAPRRFNTVVISAFAIAAALLAALGMYSVIAFSAALRAQEMAIRMALGSQRADILRLVFASAAKMTMLGCAIGLLGVAAASRLLGSFLFGVSPFDPLVLTLAAVFVLLLAWLASLLPARRAASIDLISVLRAE